jgi:hypothetical protein
MKISFVEEEGGMLFKNQFLYLTIFCSERMEVKIMCKFALQSLPKRAKLKNNNIQEIVPF